MIVIQSESNDRSTDEVIRWLHHLEPGLDVLRINDQAILSGITQRLNNSEEDFSFSILGRIFRKANISFFWYRRGHFILAKQWTDEGLLPSLSAKAGNYFRTETSSIEQQLQDSLASVAPPVNRYEENMLNKLRVLREARNQGLKIPDTLVTNDPGELMKFCRLHRQVITKAVQHNHFIAHEPEGTIGFALDTALVDIETIKRYGPQTGIPVPALFQQYIAKKIEIRVFYLNGILYPMAIFSQSRKETAVDYRGHNKQTSIRNIPYRLPATTEKKLCALFRELSLHSGSADLILTHDNDIVFLEINPIGQFQWLARNCNYPLEREIAKHILHHSKNVQANYPSPG